jgi:hypothetical protein
MPTVRVYGIIMQPQSNLPWVNAAISFVLDRGSYTNTEQYPRLPIVAMSNDSGYFEVDLWANRDGRTPTKWFCTMPDGDRFPFVLLASMNAISISALRQFNDSEDWEPTPEIPNPNLAIGAVAAINLSALRIIARTSQGWNYVDPMTETSATQAIALTISAVNTGAIVQPLLEGVVTDSSWNWQLSLPILMGANGILTQSIPSNFVQRVVGFPVTATQIYFSPREGIL